MQPRAAGDAVSAESSVRSPMPPSRQMRRRRGDCGSRPPARLLTSPPWRHCRESKCHSCSARELLHRLHFARHSITAVTSQHTLEPCLPRTARVRDSTPGTLPPNADVARLLGPRPHPRPDPPPEILSRLYQLKDGKLHGLSTWWYENGKKSGEANYVDGKAHGLETWWYENGQKSSETNYVDGKRHGTDTRWFDNGQKGRESNLKDSRRHGLETEWDKEGNVTRQVRYENGQQVETIK